MKKHSFKFFAKRVFGTALASVILFVSAVSAQSLVAGQFTENSAVVKYLGSDSDNIVFNVAYNNENGDRFILRITDETGNTLFTGTYNDKKFDKRFRLIKEGNDKLNFVIKNLKDNSVQTFAITTTKQIVEDVVVRKVI